MSDINWKEVGVAIDQYLTEKRMSVQMLADDAHVSRRTIDRIRKGHSGNITTLRKLENTLGKILVPPLLSNLRKSGDVNQSPQWLGAYHRDAVEDYIGHYHSFRYSFDYDDGVVCAITEVYWDVNNGCLKFRELQRNKSHHGVVHEYGFEGHVAIRSEIGIVQFVFADDGLHRLVTLKSMSAGQQNSMKGVLLTLNKIEDVGLYPVSTPILYLKSADTPALNDDLIGSFKSCDVWHQDAVNELSRMSDKFIASGAIMNL